MNRLITVQDSKTYPDWRTFSSWRARRARSAGDLRKQNKTMCTKFSNC